MLFKLSMNSIKKSLRDYAIYFFTLVIGVSIFYVFNAIGDQVALLDIVKKGSIKWIVDALINTISTVSVFVAIVLGLLVVYANRFIMKRRSKEFALYMTMGISKSKISIILLLEIIMIGIGSIALGLVIGIRLSQLMSALVINLFEADMSQYQFTISGTAIGKTILYFVIIYLVVMVFNNLIISRFKIINLIHSGKKSERIKLKNPILCTIIFILAAIALAYAYYQVCWNTQRLSINISHIFIYIIIGAVSTFFIFWSISGLIFRIMTLRKRKYYKGLNSFTFRQISSKINTMVTSMTIICLMLFITICTISSGFAVNNTLNSRTKEQYPTDISIIFSYYPNESSSTDDISKEIIKYFSKDGFNIQKYFNDIGFVPQKYFKEYFAFNLYNHNDDYNNYMKLSDYNKLMRFFGKETITLKEKEFVQICGPGCDKSYLDNELQNQKEITISENTLVSKYDECKYVDISFFYYIRVVSDNLIENDTTCRSTSYFIGNYNGNNKKMEKQLFNDKSLQQIFYASENPWPSGVSIHYNSKLEDLTITNSSRAVTTLLCLYIGFVFLIACGTILAIKELSDIADSTDRYKILRKLGADEKDISRSIFRQIGFFFFMPLLIACIHSIFGMKFALNLMQIVSLPNLISSVSLNAAIIILIYGGYFLITYHCCKNIIKSKK